MLNSIPSKAIFIDIIIAIRIAGVILIYVVVFDNKDVLIVSVIDLSLCAIYFYHKVIVDRCNRSF